MTTPNRICIYPKDVMRITGKSERYGRMLLDKIKQKNAKEAHQFVTILQRLSLIFHYKKILNSLY
jgi:hypothetical protein